MKNLFIDGQNPVPIIPEREAAQLLGISNNTLKRIRYANEISFYRIGNQVFYSGEMLTTFLKSCETEVSQNEH